MFALYAVTAARYPVYGDGPELMSASVNLGIAHPTGYPLLMLLGKVASLLPVGTIAYRLNLLVGLFGALAAGGMCLLACAAFGSVTAGVLGGLAFGLTPVLWHSSTNFEVYALNALFIVAALLLANKVWSQAGEGGEHRRSYFYLLALVIGLGISHHLTFLTALPAVGWIVLRGRTVWLPQRREIAGAVGALVLGLTPWLYLVFRAALPYDPYTCWLPLKGLGGVVGHIAARQFESSLFAYSARGIPLLTARALSAIWEQFGPLLLFVPAGLLAIPSRGRAVIEAGLVLVAINLPLFFGYNVSDYAVFFMATYLGLAITIAGGVAWLEGWVSVRASRLVRLAPVALAGVLLAVQFPGRYVQIRPAPESCTHAYVRKLVGSLPPDAVIILAGQWGNLEHLEFPLLYAKSVTGEIPGMTFRSTGKIQPEVVFANTSGIDVGAGLKQFLAEIGASAETVRQVLAAPPEMRAVVLLGSYEGSRPLFTDSPQLFERAGLGGAYCGYLWRIVATPGLMLEADPDDFIAWVGAQAGQPGATSLAHSNLAVPLDNYTYYLLYTGQLWEAGRLARLIGELCHKSSNAHLNAIALATSASDRSAAWEMLRHLEQTYPYRANTYRTKGTLLMGERKYREALAALELGESIGATRQTQKMAFARAVCYLGLGEVERAREIAGPELWPQVRAALAKPGPQHSN